MSTPAKSQISTGTGAGRRPARDASTPAGAAVATADLTPSRSPSRSGGRINPTTTSSGGPGRPRQGRTSSANTPISARSAIKKPGGSFPATGVRNGRDDSPDAAGDDETRAQSAATIDELQRRLRKAEESSEDDKRKIALLQLRIHDSADEHAKLEETVNELNSRIDELGNQKREILRSRKELEALYEVSKAAIKTAEEEGAAREEQLLHSIQRLKDAHSNRDSRFSIDDDRRQGRSSSLRRGASPQPDAGQFAPSSAYRSSSQSSARLVHQKDKIIEGLRMELAEAQIKLVELENMGGGQVAELERVLMDTRMTNARLMEENESFQLILSEKTLNGDLSQNGMLSPNRENATTGTMSSLAEELENADEDDEGTKQYKLQIATLKDENKALTVYINSIISRLLQHDIDFVLDKSSEGAAARAAAAADKELPPPPPEKTEDAMTGFLSRTRSLLGGRKPRPQSVILTDTTPQTANENPQTAPSIPIGRPQPRQQTSGPRRTNNPDWNTAAVVDKMYRGPSPTRASGQLSPGLSSQPNAFFGPRPGSSSRAASGSTVPTTISEHEPSAHKPNRDSKISSGRNSIGSDTSSPPQSTLDKSNVMVGNRPRPLRLVQENVDEDAARKAANRMSWMGWFNNKAQ